MNPNQYINQKLRGITRKYEYIMSKGGKCEICGYDKNLAALDFHHLDSKQKEFQIDIRKFANSKLSDLEVELDKCIILCANCHREMHHSDLNMDNISNIINTTNKKKTFSNKEYGSICPQCGKRFPKMKGKIFCSSECKNLFKHYSTKEQLEEQYNILHSWDKVAKYFNITRRITQRIRK